MDYYKFMFKYRFNLLYIFSILITNKMNGVVSMYRLLTCSCVT